MSTAINLLTIMPSIGIEANQILPFLAETQYM